MPLYICVHNFLGNKEIKIASYVYETSHIYWRPIYTIAHSAMHNQVINEGYIQ